MKKHTKTTLEYMLKVPNDENAPMTLRLAAAKAAAPYMHPRLPPVQVEEEKPGSNYRIDLTKLSDDELMQYERIWRKGEVN